MKVSALSKVRPPKTGEKEFLSMKHRLVVLPNAATKQINFILLELLQNFITESNNNN